MANVLNNVAEMNMDSFRKPVTVQFNVAEYKALSAVAGDVAMRPTALAKKYILEGIERDLKKNEVKE